MVGDVLEVIDAVESLDGYLATRVSEVLVIRTRDIDGFIFCTRKNSQPACEGWVRSCTLKCCWLKLEAVVVQGTERQDGFLATRFG